MVSLKSLAGQLFESFLIGLTLRGTTQYSTTNKVSFGLYTLSVCYMLNEKVLCGLSI